MVSCSYLDFEDCVDLLCLYVFEFPLFVEVLNLRASVF